MEWLLKDSTKIIILPIQFFFGQCKNGYFVSILIDDKVNVVERFIEKDQEELLKATCTYIRENIGEISESFEIKDDPMILKMLKKIREINKG